MPIVNKGIFDTDVVFQRQINTDWPEANTNYDLYVQNLIAANSITANNWNNLYTANVLETPSNLYFTNTRVVGALIPGEYITIESNGRISAAVDIVPSANTVVSLSNFTTDDLIESSSNLYFTIDRARSAYTEGSGIAISANGVISTRGDDTGLGLFNSGITLAANLKPTGTYQTIKTFPVIEGNSFIVFSFLVTNRSANTSYINARANIEGNAFLMANLLPLPPNSSTEVFRKPQIFKQLDSIEILSLDQDRNPAANLLTTYISYQPTLDDNFKRNAITVSDNDAYVVYASESITSIVESLNLVNVGPNVMPVDAFITNESDEIVTYLVSNLLIPPYTSVEICEYPKALLENDKIWVQKWDNPKEMTVFMSHKLTSAFEVDASTLEINEGGTVIFDIRTTNVLDGTVLYYEIQEITE